MLSLIEYVNTFTFIFILFFLIWQKSLLHMLIINVFIFSLNEMYFHLLFILLSFKGKRNALNALYV